LCENRSLLDNFDLVISTPTTMALESLMNSNYTILDGTNDGIHSSTAFNSLKCYTHLKDLKLIPNLDIAYDLNEMKQFIDKKLSENTSSKIQKNSETKEW
jgi:hypothetical protein